MKEASLPAISKEQDFELKTREIAAPVITQDEYDNQPALVLVQRLVDRLQASRMSASGLDRDKDNLLAALNWLAGSLLEVKRVAKTLITCDDPEIGKNYGKIPNECHGWELRADRALLIASPYMNQHPEAPSHREPVPAADKGPEV